MVPGALWHIWAPKFTPKIRQILKDLDKENYKKSSGNDPIHDQESDYKCNAASPFKGTLASEFWIWGLWLHRNNISIIGYKDTYITKELRAKLEEKDIYAETIIQCEGDGVFIPQGAIHQVIFFK